MVVLFPVHVTSQAALFGGCGAHLTVIQCDEHSEGAPGIRCFVSESELLWSSRVWDTQPPAETGSHATMGDVASLSGLAVSVMAIGGTLIEALFA